MLKAMRSLRKVASQAPGFTLTEILIVVVIIGILSSLTIPRFFGQAEKAKTTEAINMLSSIRRAQLQYYDSRDRTYAVIGAHCDASGNDVDANIKSFSDFLGIVIPPCANANWTYSTDTSMSGDEPSNPIATATRKPRTGETTSPSGTITINDDGTWNGTGDYKKPSGTPPTGGGKYWPF